MNKKKYFRFLSFALIITSTLMIVANNVPYLGSFRFLWAPIGLISFILLKSKILSHKMSISVLMYGVLFAGILQYTLWNFASDWYKQIILGDFYNLIIFVFLAVYLLTAREFVFWGRLAKWGVYFLIITAIMTIVATQIAPMVVRASYSGGLDKLEGFTALYKLGFGSYGFAISLVAFIPIVVYFIKSKINIVFSKNFLWSIFIVLIITLIQMQIFANILVGMLLIVLSLVSAKNRKNTFFWIIGLVLIFSIIPLKIYADILINIGSTFSTDSNVYYKLNDMASYIVNSNVSDTGMGVRYARYPELLTVFFAQPIVGDASYNSSFYNEMVNGGHLYWMSRLALWGVFGFIGYLLILKNIFQPIFNLFDKEFRYYYGLSLLSVFILGLVKNLTGREQYVMLLIIIPGLYFLSKTKLEIRKQKQLNR
ncbi:MAG: hypothetical protein QM499_07135 [Flavobacteriaceae bacterium]